MPQDVELLGGTVAENIARFRLGDSGSPAVVRDGGHETALYVLMPMRV
jgi:ABC-type protease/lipase transport system fused ATPase/permease subunit